MFDFLRHVVHKVPFYSELRWALSRDRPTSIEGKVLLHIGCGMINRPYFINVDTVPHPHIHYRKSIESTALWKNEDADFIYASHVLEHVRFAETGYVLKNLHSKLKRGGVLRLSVPDFDSILKIYSLSGRDIGAIIAPLMGHQDHQFNFHFNVFNSKSLTWELIQAGFGQVRPWDPENCQYHDFDDWANHRFEVDGQLIPISLNLEATKV